MGLETLLRLEQRLRRSVEGFPPAVRGGLLDALTAPDAERAAAIGRLYRSGKAPALAELLIDLEEEPAAKALVVGELRRLSREHGAGRLSNTSRMRSSSR